MKKLMEEEEAKAKEESIKLDGAARVIAKHWRKFKARKLTEFTQITRLATIRQFSKTIEVVYLPALKKCYICKTANAQRQCPQVNP